MYLIVIDLETMGIKPGCIVTEVGAVVINTKMPSNNVCLTFEQTIDYAASKRAGFKADKKTIDWWAEQLDLSCQGNRRACEAVFVDKWRSPDSLKKAIAHVTELYNDVVEVAGGKDNVLLVGNDIDFDKMLLEHYYVATNTPIPWHYRAWVSLPTVVWIIKEITGIDVKKQVRETWKTSHLAVDDASQEAAMLNTAFDLVRGLCYHETSETVEAQEK